MQVTLVDPSLCHTMSKETTLAMALTIVSTAVDALLAIHLGSALKEMSAAHVSDVSDTAEQGLAAVGQALKLVLKDENSLGKELLSTASMCAGRLSAVTSAPPTQVWMKLSDIIDEYCSSAPIPQSTAHRAFTAFAAMHHKKVSAIISREAVVHAVHCGHCSRR